MVALRFGPLLFVPTTIGQLVAGCLLGFRQANGIVRALHFALATCVLCGAIAGLINVRTIMAVGVLGLTYWVPKSPRR